jgi:hypothetical protein
VILFRPEHVPVILAGRKTQTRRLGKKRWNVGAVHQARTRLFGEPFALLVIRAVRQERLWSVSDEDVKREGYDTKRDYLDAFARIHRTGKKIADRLVWVVDFTRVRGVSRAPRSPTRRRN